MTMATVQFYENPYNYPDYKETLTAATSQMEMVPKGTSTTGGSLHLKGAWGEISQHNYMAIRRDGTVTWAWIDNITERTADSVVIDYSVDAFRTYKERITLGNQFIVRSPESNDQFDSLLGSTESTQRTNVQQRSFTGSQMRVLVVQASSEPAWAPNNTPVQPTPYHFYLYPYNPSNWLGASPIVDLLNKLRNNSETQNIITMYTLPYMDLSGMNTALLPLMVGSDVADTVEGFFFLSGDGSDIRDSLKRTTMFDLPVQFSGTLSRTNHSVQVAIPEAGILNIPDDALRKGRIGIRQDIDLFSGASNYMLVAGDSQEFTGVSVRGSSISSIPIISDPFDTYISQNQNALATSLIGDVASVGIGAVALAANPMAGGAMLGKGVAGLAGTATGLLDRKSQIPSNPPAFLGTAMANDFHNQFFIITKYDHQTNTSVVHQTFGYPQGLVKELRLPTSGFVQTQNCNVIGNGRVPRWALDNINTIFDNGLRVRT